MNSLHKWNNQYPQTYDLPFCHKDLYATPISREKLATNILKLVKKEGVISNVVTVALGVADEVDVGSALSALFALLPAPISAKGGLGRRRSVGCVSGVGPAVELTIWLVDCILKDSDGNGKVCVGVVFERRTCVAAY